MNIACALGTMIVATTLAASSLSAEPVSAPALPAGTIQVPAGSGTWLSGPPGLPAGTRVMRLEGDPSSEGMFTLRLQVPAGTRLQPHSHPRDERVTVLSGEVLVGFGDTFDENAMTRFTAGSFYVNPADSHHFIWFKSESVIQITGNGPWQLHYISER
jgi:quercetin dioxygenase-like cupin family protein